MKILSCILICFLSFGLAACNSYFGTGAGCGNGDDCGYRTYSSQCGLPSCTDNTLLIDYANQYSNPCPGPYDCPES